MKSRHLRNISILDDLGRACQAFSLTSQLTLVGHGNRQPSEFEVVLTSFMMAYLVMGFATGQCSKFSHKQVVAARCTSAEHKTRQDETTIPAQTFASMILTC